MRMTSATTANHVTKNRRPERGEGNAAWVRRMIADLQTAEPTQWSHLLLLGAPDQMGFRVRVAQSHLRPDLLPSYWSDAALLRLDDAAPFEVAELLQVPLLQPATAEFASSRNGVASLPMAAFDDIRRWPNIALMAIPRPQAAVVAAIARFCHARDELDALSHVLRWLSFVWGAERPGNPLHDRIGLPSACMLEAAFARLQFDLTPGVEPSKSCPEAIWASARHWHAYYAATAGEGGRVPFCRYRIGHVLEIGEVEGDSMVERLGGR